MGCRPSVVQPPVPRRGEQAGAACEPGSVVRSRTVGKIDVATRQRIEYIIITVYSGDGGGAV